MDNIFKFLADVSDAIFRKLKTFRKKSEASQTIKDKNISDDMSRQFRELEEQLKNL